MSAIISDVEFYASLNMPTADGTTTGGAVDTGTRVSFSDMAANGTVDYVSSSASDTAPTVSLIGRDSTGTLQTETKTLNGTTLVTGSQSIIRIEQASLAGTANVGDIGALSHTKVISGHTAQAGAAATSSLPASITLQSGDGANVAIGQIIRTTNNTPTGVQNQMRRIILIVGDVAYVSRDWGTPPSSSTTYDVHNGVLFDLAPNKITKVIRPFYGVEADQVGGSSRTFYSKFFAINNDTTIAAIVAAISKIADPAGLYSGGGSLDFALCNALNDSGTVANRQTAPASGITSFSSGAAIQSINVPNANQNLPPGNAPNTAGAQGIWTRLTLPAGLAAANGNFQMQATGSTI